MTTAKDLSSSTLVEALRAERDRFVAFAFAASDLLLEVDREGRVLFAAGALSALSPGGGGAVEGRHFLDLVAPEDRGFIRNLFGRLASGTSRVLPTAVTLHGQGDRKLGYLVSGYRMADLGDHIFLALSSERPNALKASSLDVTRDAESGLPDQAAFGELAQEVLKSSRRLDSHAELTFFTLKDYDAYEARSGAQAGRRLAGEIGDRLRAEAVDGMSAGRLAKGRYGLVHRPDADIAAVEASIAEAARALDPERRGLDIISATMDLACESLDEDSAVRALSYAMRRFASSHDGTLSIRNLNESYEGMLHDAVDRIGSFRHMVDDGRFRVAFQPIVDLRTGDVHHFEALARFEEGPASPFETIAFAEETGMIGEFDLTMCQRVLDLLAETGGDAPSVAVNLSGRSLGSAIFVDALRAILDRRPHARDRILFEVTESAEITDLAGTNAAIQRLRRAGHEVCLDDFGAGAAAFTYLRELEVDYVKIDGAYVRDALADARAQSFLKAMTGLCHDLDVETVAEWVENQATAAFLLEKGVCFGQGYHFGRPVFELPPRAALKGKKKAAKEPRAAAPTPPRDAAEKKAKAVSSAKRPSRRKGFQETWG